MWWRRRRQEDLDQEIRSHLEMAARDRRRRGEEPASARDAARREFGNTGLVAEVTREMWGWSGLEHWLRDLRYGLRTLARNPGFASVAVLTLALGVGANTAVFSVVHGVLLRPLPYPDPEQLVWIQDAMTETDPAGWSACMADVLLWQSRAHSFDLLAAYASNGFTITGDGEAEQFFGGVVTARFFDLLGMRPLMGRTFAAGEDQPGRERTALISERLWRGRYHSDPQILGRSIMLNGRPATIIGVTPSSFHFRSREADVWAILPLTPPNRRGPFFLQGLARLKKGVTMEQAKLEMDGLGREVENANPKGTDHVRYPITRLRESMVGDIRPLLLVLSGTVALVLFIAVLNVANLLLARASARQREMAIRVSIGAGRTQLLRQLIAESMTLAIAGGSSGVLLAYAGVRALRALAPPGLPRIDEIAIDGKVLLFTLAVSVCAGIVFGLMPAWSAARAARSGTLHHGGRGTSDTPVYRRMRGALVVAEVAFSVMLLAGAGLLIRSFALLGRVSPGFQAPPDRVLTLLVVPAARKYNEAPARAAYWSEVSRRVREVPGVEAAGMSITIPPDRAAYTDGFEIQGRTPKDGGPIVPVPVVDRDYFLALGIPLVRGRYFDEHDRPDSPGVVIVSQDLARRYFPGENPVGQRIKHGGPDLNNPYVEIVGVVGDVKYSGMGGATEPVYYESFGQNPTRPAWVVVRTRGPAAGMASAVRAAIRGIDPDVPVTEVGTMTAAMRESVALPRFRSMLMGIFATAALLLAGVGLYGVIAYSVVRRTAEIGIRMALGATSSSVLGLVVGQGSRLALAGTAIGLAGALALVKVLKKMLFGVQPTDPLTFAAAAGILVLVALLASYIPARRAAGIDPVRALRQE